jgi:hypothetical protein
MKRTFGLLLGLSALGAAACTPTETVATTTTTGAGGGSSTATSTTTGAGGMGGMEPITVTVAPSTSKTLTCQTLAFTATVTGTKDQAVTWSLSPAGNGTIDATGKYAAPIQVPTPESVDVTATSHADPTAMGSASLTLSTTRPGASVAVSKQAVAEPGVREHVISAKGAQVYSVFTQSDATSSFVYVASSSDSGATWGAPVKVNDNIGDVNAENAVVTVDAADPKVVYVAYKLDAGAGFTKSKDVVAGSSGGTMVEATSTDGGATFTNYVLLSAGNGLGNSLDIVSPGAGQVVVSVPNFYNTNIYVDSTKGAGFAKGVATGESWETTGYVGNFDNAKDPSAMAPFSYMAQNGGSEQASGSAPRLATDGAGRICLVYDGVYFSGNDFDLGSDLPYIQCSSDLGATFSPALPLDTDRTASHPLVTAAIGPNHVVTVAWEQIDTKGLEQTYLAQSTDNGKTFSAPFAHAPYVLPDMTLSQPRFNSVIYEGSTLWLIYVAYDGGDHSRLIADKSCDGGKTWSRAELTNGTEAQIEDASYAAMAVTDHGVVVAGTRANTKLFSVYPIE